MVKPRVYISSYDDIGNPYYGGGGAIAIHQVAKRLTNSYAVTVVSSSYKNSPPHQIIDGVTYERIGWTPNFLPQLGQLIFCLLLPIKVLTSHFDIWVESFTPPISTTFIPLFTHKPVIGLVHFLSGHQMSLRYKLPFHLIENFGLRFYRHLIVPNEVTKHQIVPVNPKADITVIPNGVDIPTQPSEQNQTNFGYIGRIEVQQKGLDLLIQALALLKDSQWNLLIAGDGPARELLKLRQLIQKYRVEQRVQLLGKISGDQKHTFFNQISILVVPSRFETFSMSALEGIAYCLPVISFAIPGLAWLPKQGVKQVSDLTPTALAATMAELIVQEPERKHMSIYNREYIQKFSWEKTAQAYQHIIDHINTI